METSAKLEIRLHQDANCLKCPQRLRMQNRKLIRSLSPRSSLLDYNIAQLKQQKDKYSSQGAHNTVIRVDALSSFIELDTIAQAVEISIESTHYSSMRFKAQSAKAIVQEVWAYRPSSDISTPSGSRTTELAKMELHKIGLPGLPTEIILIVARYLPPSGLMSLSYSCRVIRNKLNVSIEHSFGTKINTAQLSVSALPDNLLPRISPDGRGFTHPRPTTVRSPYHEERLKLLCMLDHDQMIPPSKAVCSGCADTHDRSLFSHRSLAQSPSERLCVGRAGRVWICPHRIFDHNLVNTSKEPLRNHFCGHRSVIMSTLKHETTEHFFMWPILVLGGNHDAPSKELVAKILARTDVNVCKHLRFSDSCLSRLYSPDCKKLRLESDDLSFCPCSTCVWQLAQPSRAGQLSSPNANGDSILGSLSDRGCGYCSAAVTFLIIKDYKSET